MVSAPTPSGLGDEPGTQSWDEPGCLHPQGSQPLGFHSPPRWWCPHFCPREHQTHQPTHLLFTTWLVEAPGTRSPVQGLFLGSPPTSGLASSQPQTCLPTAQPAPSQWTAGEVPKLALRQSQQFPLRSPVAPSAPQKNPDLPEPWARPSCHAGSRLAGPASGLSGLRPCWSLLPRPAGLLPLPLCLCRSPWPLYMKEPPPQILLVVRKGLGVESARPTAMRVPGEQVWTGGCGGRAETHGPLRVGWALSLKPTPTQ